MSGILSRLAAQGIRATTIVDTLYRRFDSLRSVLVARLAPDSVLEAFNDLTYGRSAVYRPDAGNFRSELFNWEKEALAFAFPKPPARVLIGGAGGGREAFALATAGYDVVAFEPSERLVRSMAAHRTAAGRVEAYAGRYEELPIVRQPGVGTAVDLHTMRRFDAAVFGWTSFSHIRHATARVRAMREIGALTDGPVLISFYMGRTAAPSSSRQLTDRVGLRNRRDYFTTHVGFYHLSTPEELRAESREAGLDVTHECLDDSDGRWPYVVLRRVPRAQST